MTGDREEPAQSVLNSRMRDLAIDWDDQSSALASALKTVLEQGLVETGGCVVLGLSAGQALNASEEPHQDEVGFEAFWNHLHIDDYVPTESTPARVVEQTVAYVQQLTKLLRRLYATRRFSIYVAIQEEDDRDQPTTGLGLSGGADPDRSVQASVRFHTVRDAQPLWAADLEGFVSEAVMRIDLGPSLSKGPTS